MHAVVPLQFHIQNTQMVFEIMMKQKNSLIDWRTEFDSDHTMCLRVFRNEMSLHASRFTCIFNEIDILHFDTRYYRCIVSIAHCVYGGWRDVKVRECQGLCNFCTVQPHARGERVSVVLGEELSRSSMDASCVYDTLTGTLQLKVSCVPFTFKGRPTKHKVLGRTMPHHAHTSKSLTNPCVETTQTHFFTQPKPLLFLCSLQTRSLQNFPTCPHPWQRKLNVEQCGLCRLMQCGLQTQFTHDQRSRVPPKTSKRVRTLPNKF